MSEVPSSQQTAQHLNLVAGQGLGFMVYVLGVRGSGVWCRVQQRDLSVVRRQHPNLVYRVLEFRMFCSAFRF